MKKTLLIVLLLVFHGAGVLAAPPALPASFYGTVRINGHDAPSGSVISARILGNEYGRGTVIEDALSGSVYALDVVADDIDTIEIEGGRDGDLVTFVVEMPDGPRYTVAQTGIWRSGVVTELNLRVVIGLTLPLILVGP